MKFQGKSLKILFFTAIFAAALFSEPLYSQTVEQINFNNLTGSWNLMYENNYGYSFSLGRNYNAVVILYLSTASIIFKGVYTIEEKDLLRINISEMKREEKVKDLNTRGGFKKAKSSYFTFQSRVVREGGKSFLEVRPVKISIDGNDSEGYFEPLIRLSKAGK